MLVGAVDVVVVAAAVAPGLAVPLESCWSVPMRLLRLIRLLMLLALLLLLVVVVVVVALVMVLWTGACFCVARSIIDSVSMILGPAGSASAHVP